MHPAPDTKKVQVLKERVNRHLLEARLSRGTDWVKSVDNFYEAINDLKTLSNEVPPISEVRWRIFGITIAILSLISISTILKLILNIWDLIKIGA